MAKRDTTSIPKTNENINETKHDNGEASLKLNWDVIGITATTITLVGAAIFFISGWFYQTHWYSFYGIEVSSTTLSPVNFMVQGVPGILIFLVLLTPSWFIVNIFQEARINRRVRQSSKRNEEQYKDISKQLRQNDSMYIAGLAYLFVFALLYFFNHWLIQKYSKAYQTPQIVIFSLVVAFIIFFILVAYGAYFQFPAYLIQELNKRRATNRKLQWFKVSASFYSSSIAVLTIATIMIVFLTSIAASALFGTFDAINAQRSLSGWRMPVFLVRSVANGGSLNAMFGASVLRIEDETYDGPFGLILTDENKYYLVWLSPIGPGGEAIYLSSRVSPTFEDPSLNDVILFQFVGGHFVYRPPIIIINKDNFDLVSYTELHSAILEKNKP